MMHLLDFLQKWSRLTLSAETRLPSLSVVNRGGNSFGKYPFEINSDLSIMSAFSHMKRMRIKLHELFFTRIPHSNQPTCLDLNRLESLTKPNLSTCQSVWDNTTA